MAPRKSNGDKRCVYVLVDEVVLLKAVSIAQRQDLRIADWIERAVAERVERES